jgi:hypothetical protein
VHRVDNTPIPKEVQGVVVEDAHNELIFA